MFVQIGDQVAMLNPSRSFGRRRCRATQRGFDARHQLRKAQWFGDVVIRAQLEAADLVTLRSTRCRHDDRYSTELSDTLDDLPAVESGQRNVEHDEVRMAL